MIDSNRVKNWFEKNHRTAFFSNSFMFDVIKMSSTTLNYLGESYGPLPIADSVFFKMYNYWHRQTLLTHGWIYNMHYNTRSLHRTTTRLFLTRTILRKKVRAKSTRKYCWIYAGVKICRLFILICFSRRVTFSWIIFIHSESRFHLKYFLFQSSKKIWKYWWLHCKLFLQGYPPW